MSEGAAERSTPDGSERAASGEAAGAANGAGKSRTRRVKRPTRAPFELAGEQVAPGEHRLIDLQVTRLYTHSDVVIPVHIVHGKVEGPRLFVAAAVHGDEINGVEVIRRLLKRRSLGKLRGTLIATPVVNVHGFMAHSRYLPDRRDLNRSFPGSEKGSLASRLAHLFMEQVVARATHGIDLHTGSNHRSNLPQIRADLDNPETRRLACAFGAPVVINSKLRDGSLRQAAAERGMPLLLYEGGEALRFDETVTRAALQGILNVMRELGMLPPSRGGRPRPEPLVAETSTWLRAQESGVLVTNVRLGSLVRRGQLLGLLTDPYGTHETQVISPFEGVVIGKLECPLVNEGDPLFHIAPCGTPEEVEAAMERFEARLDIDDRSGEVPRLAGDVTRELGGRLAPDVPDLDA